MVIAIIILIVGTLSLLNLPMEQYPDITPPMVEVSATYTGANALNVEQSVATPLEQQINGVDNMIYMKSINANDGSMKIQITFEVGTDPDMNTVFSQNRVSSATPKLPEEVKRIGVNTDKTMSSMIMAVSLYSDGRYDQEFLGNYALINIKDILARIKGVGRVSVLGASDYSMRIWVQPDKLAHLGITVPEITAAIRAQNVIVPGGKFGAEPAPAGTDFTYSVRMPERLVSEEEFGDIVIRTQSDGSQVRISDVASVELGVESYNVVTRFAKSECALITLYQAPGTNAVDLASQVIAAMEEMKSEFDELSNPLHGFADIQVVFDPTSEALCADVFSSWSSFSQREGLTIGKSKQSFGHILKTVYPNVVKERRMVNGKQNYVYAGLKLVGQVI